MTERDMERRLRIHTAGRDDHHADRNHHPYEPTPYAVLERLAKSGYITPTHTLMDCGCGKGRAAIALSVLTGCHAVGVEYDGRLWQEAEKNRLSCPAARRVRFVCADVLRCDMLQADCFYFFNPFSAALLQGVLGRIADAERQSPARIFFYYPDDECRALLATHPALRQTEVIDCRDLFEGNNPRECILVYETLQG